MSEMGADLVASKTFSILTLKRLFELLIYSSVYSVSYIIML